ncbi:ceramide phosphoethanolamine synthase [Chrysoperla carnea]|uniref:ceramide phosphoethanolamine synthase n=1 Tax=Chrysoperla carnea TaxID=189513 RepID=UPI001D08D361|nr:ceramide phosphoethanolamine synthase [Chrysoperla carnea]XP_044730928.1 ceramide phosphoethanolamine synthase [Chrysoperla carnea]XP_044730929.1 ceramide phosphoethanolamine synthase [Chrysoperla carnea]XP_044730930.1 ceramide phosphoethanolamine synthase [Chrysoperla carnea]
MVGPSSQISKILLAVLLLVIIFYIYMDVQLYLRIQNYSLERTFHGKQPEEQSSTSTNYVTSISILANNLNQSEKLKYSDVTWLGCNITPLCDVTVKALLLDHTNHYLFSPGATILDNLLSISESHLWITPNLISTFHVFVAIIAGKCVSSDSLVSRRIGVILFEIRTFLDDLDGHVARARKHIKGERSEIGTSGYYIDGLCDALGCISLLIGIFVYLKNNPPRRGYVQLQAILPTDTKSTKHINDGVIYKAKVTTKKVARTVGCFTAQLLLSSTLWNRYIAVYQDMLERDHNITYVQYLKQLITFKSSLFFCVAWLWRVVNVHNMMHILLLSMFCDKLWEFLRSVQYIGFIILICVICITEMHILEVQNYIFNNLTGYNLPL